MIRTAFARYFARAIGLTIVYDQHLEVFIILTADRAQAPHERIGGVVRRNDDRDGASNHDRPYGRPPRLSTRIHSQVLRGPSTHDSTANQGGTGGPLKSGSCRVMSHWRPFTSGGD